MFKQRKQARVAFVVAVLILSTGGCELHHETDSLAPFGTDESSYRLIIQVDLSGSFLHLMLEDGHAYQFLMEVLEKYFQGRIGTGDRVIIGQLSGNQRSLLFEGTPSELREIFPTAQVFRDFLLSKCDPRGSRVHDGITDALEYLMSDPRVQAKGVKSACFVLSDLDDNMPDDAQSEERLKSALSAYGECGGFMGCYFVDARLVGPWKRRLEDAGLVRYQIESDIRVRPTLPNFED